MKTGLKSLLIAGLLANAALVAHAQTTAPAATPAPMHGRMDPAKMEAMMEKMNALVAANATRQPDKENIPPG